VTKKLKKSIRNSLRIRIKARIRFRVKFKVKVKVGFRDRDRVRVFTVVGHLGSSTPFNRRSLSQGNPFMECTPQGYTNRSWTISRHKGGGSFILWQGTIFLWEQGSSRSTSFTQGGRVFWPDDRKRVRVRTNVRVKVGVMVMVMVMVRVRVRVRVRG
jgi:hypothetical protein